VKKFAIVLMTLVVAIAAIGLSACDKKVTFDDLDLDAEVIDLTVIKDLLDLTDAVSGIAEKPDDFLGKTLIVQGWYDTRMVGGTAHHYIATDCCYYAWVKGKGFEIKSDSYPAKNAAIKIEGTFSKDGTLYFINVTKLL